MRPISDPDPWRSALLLGVVFATLGVAPSRALELTLVPDSSRVEYRIGHTLGPVTNTAGTPAGVVREDSVPGYSRLQGQVTVDLRALRTGIGGRDHHIKSEEYLDVERHPLATFTLTGVAPDSSVADTALAAGQKGQAQGTLELHGVTRDVTLPVTLVTRAGGLRVRGAFTLALADYKIKRPKKLMFAAAPTVDVTLDLLFAP